MKNRILLAYSGDLETTLEIPRLAASHQADIIAVALDLGNGPPLAELRESALTAGAIRCHALDVREEFARDSIVPALRAGVFDDAAAAVAALARDFISKKIAEIARVEQASVLSLEPSSRTGASAFRYSTSAVRHPHHAEHAWRGPRRGSRILTGPAYIEIEFEDGTPVAVNGVPMTLIELMESVETITGSPAIDVLALAYLELGHSHRGRVALRVSDGECTVVSPAVAL